MSAKQTANPAPTTTKTADIDDTRETVSQFLDKIIQAQGSKTEWIETTPEIIAHYNRNGLGGKNYFIYGGIKVCEKGKLEETIAQENEQLGVRLHGPMEGKIEGR